jgi:hypothetical protein
MQDHRVWEACNQVFRRCPSLGVIDQDIFLCSHFVSRLTTRI